MKPSIKNWNNPGHHRSAPRWTNHTGLRWLQRLYPTTTCTCVLLDFIPATITGDGSADNPFKVG